MQPSVETEYEIAIREQLDRAKILERNGKRGLAANARRLAQNLRVSRDRECGEVRFLQSCAKPGIPRENNIDGGTL